LQAESNVMIAQIGEKDVEKYKLKTY
jgi:hypothetical protein